MLHPVAHLPERVSECRCAVIAQSELLQYLFSLFDIVPHLQNNLQAFLLHVLVLGPSCHLPLVLPKCCIHASPSIVQHSFLDLLKLNINILQILRSLIQQILKQAYFIL
jgi:hypothetical protein